MLITYLLNLRRKVNPIEELSKFHDSKCPINDWGKYSNRRTENIGIQLASFFIRFVPRQWIRLPGKAVKTAEKEGEWLG
jgi:hypothetical protein